MRTQAYSAHKPCTFNLPTMTLCSLTPNSRYPRHYRLTYAVAIRPITSVSVQPSTPYIVRFLDKEGFESAQQSSLSTDSLKGLDRP